MRKLANVVIEKIKKLLKIEKPILDKKGRPMTKEQVEEAWGMLKSYFYLDFLDNDTHGKNLRDSDEMDDYRPDAERLHKLEEFLLLEYETLDILIKNSKKHSKVYPLEHVLTEKEKKRLPAKYVKRNDEMIVDHLALQRQYRNELKKRMQVIKEELMSMGVMLPEWEKAKKKSKFTLHFERKKQEQSKDTIQNRSEISK